METGESAQSAPARDTIERGELKRRATESVVVVATRGIAVLVIGFAGNVLVARMLDPGDLGVVAIGMTFVLFTTLISDGGLGAGLIRRPEPPTREELGALTGLQLTITGAVTAAAFALADHFGRAGGVTALMVASMPLVALQFPGRILLERSLRYRRVAAVEVSQVICYHGWAVGMVAAGFGVWGLATAAVIRGGVGAIAMGIVCPEGLVRPRWNHRLIRGLLGFGIRFQAVTGTWMLRDQALNLTVGAIGGVAPLGLWALAKRVQEVPFLLLETLWRVSFPTMSHLVAEKEEVSPLVQRAAGMTATGTVYLLAALAAAAPGLIPGVFGPQWAGAAAVIPGACLGLAIGGSVSVATQGYLYAVGASGTVLRAALLQTVCWFAITVPLLPVVGVAAVGMGWGGSAVVEALVLGRAAARRLDVHLFRPVFTTVAAGSCAAVPGWLISSRGGATLASGTLGAACAVLLLTAALAAVNRPVLRDTRTFATRAIRTAVLHRG